MVLVQIFTVVVVWICVLNGVPNILYNSIFILFFATTRSNKFSFIYFHSGEAGNAARMMLILNMVQGSFMATIAEGLTLAQATGQSQQTFLDILCQGQMASTFVDQKCQSKSNLKTS